ncbi:MAG: right-handed parallel beta-helix repeat-containing protein, partial [Chitinophagales bacterium]
MNAQTNLSGNITTDSTLTLAGSPYTLTGNLTVAVGATLTVDNGVQVLFNNTSRRMYIYGTLNATGATFTSNQGSPAAGDWSTIYVGNGSNVATATFTSCQISYGSSIEVANASILNLIGSDVSDMTNYGVIISNGGTANVTNVSTISNCQYGAYVQGGDLVLNNSDILNCSNSGIYLTSEQSNVSLTDVEITNCDWPIKFAQEASLTLAGTNNFTGNTHNGIYIQLTTIDATLNLPYVDIPWYFYYSGNITVTNTGAIIVADNNILKFDGTILVDGQFTANASAGNNIFITSVRDDNWGGDTNDDGNSSAPAVSDWGGIRFRTASNDGANILRRCQIRYGGQSNQYGAVDCENASPTIDLCEFQSNYFGASFRGSSDPIFTNNTIGSSTQTPVAMTFDANPTFTNNSFSFSDNNYDAIGLLGSTLTRNATLIKRDVTAIPNVTYVLLGNVTVPATDTLNIVPGIVIKPLSNTQLIIEGTLIAKGTMSEKIVFTSIKDDNFG